MEKVKDKPSESSEQDAPKKDRVKPPVVLDPESLASRERAHAIKVKNTLGGE